VAAAVFCQPKLYWRACQGFFYEPTILADVQEGVRIVDEEQFGPVMPLIKYTDVEDAMARANDTDFGLGASVCKITRHHRPSLAVLFVDVTAGVAPAVDLRS
jgi:acyl-CoA reductase-like NAD-dependent aldehyde dehydrogenase